MAHTIALTRGKRAIVDARDLSWLADRHWYVLQSGANNRRFVAASGYNKGKVKTRVLMHRVIWEHYHGPIPEGHTIDHINHNPLDNRLGNLRVCTLAENKQNSRPYRNSSSQYKGVSLTKSGRWRAYIRVEGKLIHLGRHDSEEDAARAYNRAAREHFGEFAYLNQLDPSDV